MNAMNLVVSAPVSSDSDAARATIAKAVAAFRAANPTWTQEAVLREVVALEGQRGIAAPGTAKAILRSLGINSEVLRNSRSHNVAIAAPAFSPEMLAIPTAPVSTAIPTPVAAIPVATVPRTVADVVASLPIPGKPLKAVAAAKDEKAVKAAYVKYARSEAAAVSPGAEAAERNWTIIAHIVVGNKVLVAFKQVNTTGTYFSIRQVHTPRGSKTTGTWFTSVLASRTLRSATAEKPASVATFVHVALEQSAPFMALLDKFAV